MKTVEARRVVLTAYAARWATGSAKRIVNEAISAAERCKKDADREKRLGALECPSCFYIRSSRVGGASMTTWYCGVCAEEGLHGSTAVPRVCRRCAEKHSLCVQCGGDLNMRERRRKWPEPLPERSERGADSA